MPVGGFSERLAFILELDDRNAVSALKRVGDTAERELGRTDDRLNRLGSRMQVAGAGAVAFAGIAARGLYSLAEASEEANRSTLALHNTYANAPQLAGESAEAVMELADAIQSKTAADADDIVGGAAVLGQYGAEQDAILALTPLIVDLARKKGIDMVAANTAIGKALDGNIGALARMGIVVDETAFAEDRMTAVTDALRNTVGGFAEQEGATFAGQVERMKNQLGDLAEGVGSGVVEAFSGFADATGTVVERLGSMDEGTQKGIGKFAAYATAAVGVIGALSFTAGTVAKLADRFTTVVGSGDNATRSLNRFGSAAAGLSLVATVAGLAAMGNEMNELRVEIDELNSAMDDNAEQAVVTAAAAARVGGGFDDLASKISSQSVPAAERMLDSLREFGPALGITADELAEFEQALNDKKEADVQGAIDQQNYTGAVDAAAEASGELTDETEGLGEAAEDTTEKFQDLADAMGEVYDELLRGLDLESDYQAALDGMTESLIENGYTLDLNTEQGRNNYEQARETGDAIVALMQQRFEETGSLVEATNAGNLYVENLKTQLREAGLTEEQVAHYIGTLHLTPSEITTHIVANTSQAVEQVQALQRYLAGVTANSYQVDVHARTVGARASGGPVRAGEPYLVGEDGPEIVVPGQSGTVIPNGGSVGSGTAVGGAVFNITVNAGMGTNGTEVGNSIVDALAAWVRSNGALPFAS